MAVFADHDDGGVCRSRCWRCLQTTMMAVLGVLNQTQFRTMTLGLHNIHTYHVHTGHRVRRLPFYWHPHLCGPPISYHRFYPNAVHTMLDPRPFAFLSWGLGLPNTSIGPLPFHKLKLNSTRGSTVSAGLQPPADQRAIAPTPGWSF